MAYKKMVGENKNVLGVRIDDVSQEEAIEFIKRRLLYKKSSSATLVFTPGPEFLVTAQKDEEFKKVLNSSDLNVPDGVGLRFAGVQNRVPGVDLMIELCELASEKGWTVGLLGGVNDVASKVAKIFPKLKVKYALSDYEADNYIASCYDDVDVLLVGLGHPKQEKLLIGIVKDKKFRIGIGVGGSFDLIAGMKKRAPHFIQQIGFEWLWRGFQDPKHFMRVWKATVEYLWLLMVDKL